MSAPDDQYKTLGLPPGARNKLLREIEREKQLAAQQAAGQAPEPAPPAEPRSPAPPARPPSAPAARKPGQPPPGDPSRESYETIPPVGGFPRRRDLPGLDDLDQGRGPRSQGPPSQPWDAGFAADPPSAPRGPDDPSIHSGWTIAGPSPAEQPTPWDDEGFIDSTPPPPKPPAAQAPPPPRPAPASRGVEQHGSTVGWPAAEADARSTPFAGAAPEGRGPSPTVGVRPRQPTPLAPPRPPAGRPPVEDGANRTVAYDRDLHGPQTALLTLQFYNTDLRRWSDLGAARGERLELGRSAFQDWNPNPEDLAERHVRLLIADGRILVEPLPSLNGVYIKLRPNSPAELAPGARFRIGRHVLEFRPGGAAEPREARRADDGEVFQSRLLAPLGFVDLIGPDDQAYLSYPLTKPDEPGTRIGRGGSRCDLALTGDDWASSEHARIYFAGGKCWLEDTKSTNGTFLQIGEPVQIQPGSAPRPDTGDVVVIGGYMIRVVEERR